MPACRLYRIGKYLIRLSFVAKWRQGATETEMSQAPHLAEPTLVILGLAEVSPSLHDMAALITGVLPMNSDPANALNEQRLTLLQKKVGKLLAWKVPDVVPTVGPFDLSPFHDFETELLTVIGRCKDKLSYYSDAQIETLTEQQTGPVTGLKSEWNSFQKNEVHWLTKHQPSWFAGGFGHPDHLADFDHWARMPRFTIEELTFLSIGVEPENFTMNDLGDIQKLDVRTLGAPIQFLLRRFEQLRRQFSPRGPSQTATPRDFLSWADRVEFETHPEFLAVLRKYHGNAPQQKASTGQVPKPDKREIDTIAQILAAIAIEEYGWRPSSARSSIPREISDIAATNGFDVSAETVLKYLRIGAGFLPAGWEPDKR